MAEKVDPAALAERLEILAEIADLPAMEWSWDQTLLQAAAALRQRPQEETPAKCATAHEWSNNFGDDWHPEKGTPCDCGKRRWGWTRTQAQEETHK